MLFTKMLGRDLRVIYVVYNNNRNSSNVLSTAAYSMQSYCVKTQNIPPSNACARAARLSIVKLYAVPPQRGCHTKACQCLATPRLSATYSSSGIAASTCGINRCVWWSSNSSAATQIVTFGTILRPNHARTAQKLCTSAALPAFTSYPPTESAAQATGGLGCPCTGRSEGL